VISCGENERNFLSFEEWQEICRKKLAKEKSLTSNLFSSPDGVELHNIDVYVPLGLEERKQQKKVKGDFSPEQFGQNSQEQVTITPISEDQFFHEVLRAGQSPTSQGKRLAIIGEAGAGKTTRLQAIANFILDHNLGLPIWVPLRQLTGSFGLSDFLENWLKNATGQKNLWSDFQAQFKAGKVWLLLDSLDELTSRVTLDYGYLLQGWWSDARIIVTCRVNVWDNYRESFHKFDVYRNLEFQEDGVKSFIEKFFGKVEQLEAGEELWSILQGENHSRLRDLIGNPLRLFLVCWLWYQGERALPETQAGLYKQLVKQLYIWKSSIFDISPEQPQQLQVKLSELALMAINGKDQAPRFWFRESLLKQVFGTVDDPICKLALRVGLINQLGQTAEPPIDKAYGFYHATFQEYFAALGVPHWKDFLPRNHINFPLKDQQYRIFSSEWEQVILLWFGRSDIDYKVKEEFIRKLLSFDDGCGEWNFDSVDKGFYTYQAYFLAGVVVNEFKTCSLIDQIIEQIVKWRFGDFNKEKQHLQAYFYPIAESGREILLRTLKEKVINNLIQVLESIDNDKICGEIADDLGKIAIGNKLAIRSLINTLYTTDNFFTCCKIIKSLGEIAIGNDLVVQILINYLQFTDYNTYNIVADSLNKICPRNDLFIQILINDLQSTDDYNTQIKFANILARVDPGNNFAIGKLLHILHTVDNHDVCRWVAYNLWTIAVGNDLAIHELIDILENSKEETHWLVAQILSQIAVGNDLAIRRLIYILKNITEPHIRIDIIYTLGEIAVGNQLAIHKLINILESNNDHKNNYLVAYSLGKIDPGNDLAVSELTRILENTKHDNTCWLVAYSLAKIDPGNDLALQILINYLQSNNCVHSNAILDALGEATGNDLVIQVLISILETTDNNTIQYAITLSKIGVGNEFAIKKLIHLLETTNNDNTNISIAYILGEIIITGEYRKVAINSLKKYLNNETYKNNFALFEKCYKTLWNIAQNLTYPEFYQAWHNNPLPLNLSQLAQLLPEQIENHNLTETHQIFLIDGSKFIDRDNPSLDIYEQLLEQQCQPRPNGEPENLSQLKSYWGQIRRNSDKKTILVFYENPTPPMAQGFSPKFINTFSRFEGAIALIDDNIQSDHIKTFTSQDPNLLQNIIDWLKTIS
jgi:HEAT repeat protein